MASPVSVGDVIAVCILIKDVVKALDDATGASSEYQEVIRELWSLDRALLEVELLSRTCDTTIELNALCHTARRTTEQCRDCITDFLDKIKSYRCSLRAGGSSKPFRDGIKKLQWSITQKDDLANFRTQINGHNSAINMLLITASVHLAQLHHESLDTHLSEAQKEIGQFSAQQITRLDGIQQRLEENSRQLSTLCTISQRLLNIIQYFLSISTELKSLMSNIWTISTKTYTAVIQLQSQIPKQIGPCWIQEPLLLVDALGRKLPIHLELVNSWFVFETVLAARFNNLPGRQKIDRKEYVLYDQNASFDVDFSQPFEASFQPGHSYHMSMIFRERYSSTSCPGCSGSYESGLSTHIHCKNCGLSFQRKEKTLESTPSLSIANPPVAESSKGMGSAKRKLTTTFFENDDLRAFRNVRLLNPPREPQNLIPEMDCGANSYVAEAVASPDNIQENLSAIDLIPSPYYYTGSIFSQIHFPSGILGGGGNSSGFMVSESPNGMNIEHEGESLREESPLAYAQIQV